jgi:hypothetical protein
MASRATFSDKTPETLAAGSIRLLIGKKCWRARVGHGGELQLHLGAHVPYTSPKMAGKTKGSWRFGTCGTRWEIQTPKGRVAANEQNAKHFEETRVTGFKLTGETLTITFSNKCRLRVVPAAEDDQCEVPYWELFAPGHKLITFGPAGKWSFRRSDVPLAS